MSSAVPGQPPSDPDGELSRSWDIVHPDAYTQAQYADGQYAEGQYAEAVDVGDFDQGTQFSRWALARYIVGRVVLERVSWSLLVIAGVLIVLAVLAQVGLHSTLLCVLLAVVAAFVLVLRLLLRVILRRLMGTASYGPLEHRVRGIVGDAGSGVVKEMRRVGLPSGLLTMPLVIVRLAGKRRRETLARMREFDVERAVPKARRDELHLVIREAFGSPPPPRG